MVGTRGWEKKKVDLEFNQYGVSVLEDEKLLEAGG
jgi:hypothetical protein